MESQFGACAVRISRLKADGTPDYGNAKGALCIVGGVNKFKHDFAVEKGKEIYDTDACGNPVVILKLDDKTKWATFDLTLAKEDDRLPELTGLGQVLGNPANPSGHTIDAAAGCSPTSQARVCIELWRQRINCASAMTPPFKRVVLPSCVLSPQGFDSQDAVALPVYSGIAQVNNSLSNGPFSDLEEIHYAKNWIYAEVVDDAYCSQPSPFDYTPIPAHVGT